MEGSARLRRVMGDGIRGSFVRILGKGGARDFWLGWMVGLEVR